MNGSGIIRLKKKWYAYRRARRAMLVKLAQEGLWRRREAADLRRMDADEELQVGPAGEIPARLHEPVDHGWKRVRRVMQLGVPAHVGEESHDGLGRVETN